MKVAVLSESPADEAAILIFIDGILERETQKVLLPPLRARAGGWPGVRNILPVVLLYLQYQTDADALAVITDSDDSPIHQSSHDEAGREDMECRLCQLRSIVAQTKNRLRPRSSGEIIKTAIGLAVPAIEAWYRCGVDQHLNEATWHRKLQGERITYTRNSLKMDVYGTERPLLEMETACAIEAATRLANDISILEQLFPNGFGALARDVRS